MLIIHASPDYNIDALISLIQESSCDFTMQSFDSWEMENSSSILPQGFIYIHTPVDLVVKRMPPLSQGTTKTLCSVNEAYFIHKTIMPAHLIQIPLLVLNGTIHIDNDFSQFYTHLFSIKKFFETIKATEDKAKGIPVPPKKQKRCKC